MTGLCFGRKVAEINVRLEVTKLPGNPAQDGLYQIVGTGAIYSTTKKRSKEAP